MADNHALSSLASQQHGIVSHEQLHRLGFSGDQIYRRVASGIWTRASPRVISLAGPPTTWWQRATAAGLSVDGHGALSHRPAGRIWGLRTVDDEIDVSIRYPQQLTVPGAHVHRSRDLQPHDVTWFNGLPVTTPERTICDYGLIFPETEVERVLQHGVAGDNPLVTRREVLAMRWRISEHGRDGAGKTGRCLERLPAYAEEAESGPEVRLLQICEQHGLPAPARQLPIVVAGNRFRVDFAYPTLRVFIEIDGNATHLGDQIANDDGRQNLLVAAGWRPIRFTYQQLKKSPDWCASTIRSICDDFSAHSAA